MLVRFHARSYVHGRIVDAGDVMEIADDMPMHEHMENVDTGEFGELLSTAAHSPVFLDHTGDAFADRDGSGAYNPVLAARAKRG